MLEPVFTCQITCDVCGRQDTITSRTAQQVDAEIGRLGWTRFGPSGADLCHKCHGASPNTIVQVRKP